MALTEQTSAQPVRKVAAGAASGIATVLAFVAARFLGVEIPQDLLVEAIVTGMTLVTLIQTLTGYYTKPRDTDNVVPVPVVPRPPLA